MDRDIIDEIVKFWDETGLLGKLFISVCLLFLVMAILPEPWSSFLGILGFLVLAGLTAYARAQITNRNEAEFPSLIDVVRTWRTK